MECTPSPHGNPSETFPGMPICVAQGSNISRISLRKFPPLEWRLPVKRKPIRATAEGNRYRVTFDAFKKRVILEKSEESAPRNDVEELMDGTRRVLGRSGRRKFTVEEKEKILEILSVLVS